MVDYSNATKYYQILPIALNNIILFFMQLISTLDVKCNNPLLWPTMRFKTTTHIITNTKLATNGLNYGNQ